MHTLGLQEESEHVCDPASEGGAAAHDRSTHARPVLWQSRHASPALPHELSERPPWQSPAALQQPIQCVSQAGGPSVPVSVPVSGSASEGAASGAPLPESPAAESGPSSTEVA